MRTEAVPPKLSQEAPSIASFDTSKIGPGKHAHTRRDPRQALAAQANSRSAFGGDYLKFRVEMLFFVH